MSLKEFLKQKMSPKTLTIALIKTVCLIFLICFIFYIWAFEVEPYNIRTNYLNLTVSNWHKEHESLKIAVISDVHIGFSSINKEKFKKIIAQVNAENPDIILLLGDYIDHTAFKYGIIKPSELTVLFKNFHSKYGIIGVLGNHDWWYNGVKIRKSLENAGITILENNAVKINIKEKSFWVAGLADLWTRKPDINLTLKNIKDNNPIILLTHNPDTFPEVPTRVSLTLAGHTHGGQVSIPLIGPPITASKYGKRYASGIIKENNKLLYVTTGVASYPIPIRFLVPPEVVILKLSAK